MLYGFLLINLYFQERSDFMSNEANIGGVSKSNINCLITISATPLGNTYK